MWIPSTAPRRSSGRVRPLIVLVCGLALFGLPLVQEVVAETSSSDRSDDPPTSSIALEVRVEGLDGDLEHNVLSFLSIQRFSEEGELPPVWIRRLHSRAPDEIAEGLQPFGLYRPVIDAELLEEGSRWTAIYRVDPGEPARISTLELLVSGDGAETEPFREAVDSFPLAVGDVLLHQQYEAGRRVFRDTAARLGYFDAAFETRHVEVDLISYTASIRLDFRTGERYNFGDIRFVHDDLVKDRLLLAALDFETGDPFDLAQLQSLQVKLTDTSFFSNIEVETLRDEAVGRDVPVRITLLPAKQGRYNFGVGYGTDTGLRGQARWNLRRLNRRGHSATVWVRASQRETSFTARYRVPLPRPKVERLEAVVGYGERDTDTYETLKGWGGVGTSRTFGRWRQVATLGVQADDFTVGPDVGETVHFIPGLSYELIEADDRIAPNLGFRLRFDFQGASEEVLSDHSYFKAEAGLKGVFGFGPQSAIGLRHRLLGRLDLGWLATADFRLLPPDMRFFTGGDQSLRGFGYHTVGGRDENGEVIGGDSLVVGSVEYEYRVTEALGGALFIDAGMAGQTAREALAIGTGFGVRMRTPIGPVRLDLAWAISEPGDPVRVHLSVGPDL